MRRMLACLMLLVLLPAVSMAATLSADANAVTHEISDTLYGLFFEDINYAADGGLYAELLLNRSFEYQKILNPQRADRYTGWNINALPFQKADWQLMEEGGLHPNNPHYLSVSLQDSGMRMMNQGFCSSALSGGVYVEAGKNYDFSLYLRRGNFTGTVTAFIANAGSQPISNSVTFDADTEWKKYTAVLTPEKTADAWLCVTVEGSGRMDVDMLSLMPQDRIGRDWPGGGLRADLVEALRDLKPAFLRFPGGCVAEGSYYRENAYNWKDTVGPVEQRRENPNTWGGMQTYGLGYYEYFCLAEEIGALPLPVVHAGMLCQARDRQDTDYTPDEVRAYAQDILDLIEFATGDTDTVWGGLRARMGHPAPFDLRYIAIGNENWGTAYFTRYGILRKIVKEKYPDITCIVAAGPVAEGSLIRDSWNQIRTRFPDDVVDEHYYMESNWFLKNTGRYDSYPRITKVFLGEYAAHEPVQGSRRPNNLHAALCEAAYMTGLERNSDLVIMAAYAPLLAREEKPAWTPDLIWFNEKAVVLTPSYHVQKMFANTVGDQVVESALDDGKLYHVVTRTDTHLQIKVVNMQEEEVPFSMRLSHVPDGEGMVTCLSGTPKHTNSFVKPEKVIPVQNRCAVSGGSAEYVLPASSVTIFEFPLK